MASCPKCGKPKLRKDAFGRRRCPKCGILRGVESMNRSGYTAIEMKLSHFLSKSEKGSSTTFN